MKCPTCKRNIPDDSKICCYCGYRIEENGGVINCSNPQCKKEIPFDSKFCPFCGTSLTTTNESRESDLVFPLYDIKLGVTTIAEIADAQQLWDDIEENEPSCNLKLSSGLTVIALNSPYNPIIGLEEDWESDDVHRDCWKAILPISPDNTRKEIISWCKNNHLSFDDSVDISILLESHTLVRIDPDYGIFAIMIPPCPKCGKTNVQLEQMSDEVAMVRCKSCKHKFNVFDVLETLYPERDERCPQCGSDDYTDDGSGHIQYTCNHCGHIWGNESHNHGTDKTSNDSAYGTYQIDEDCISCGTCIDECPSDAISEGEPYYIDPEICVCCGACAEICPCGCISINK